MATVQACLHRHRPTGTGVFARGRRTTRGRGRALSRAVSADARAMPKARAGHSRAEVRAARRRRGAADDGGAGDAARHNDRRRARAPADDAARARARAAQADRAQAAARDSCRASRSRCCPTRSSARASTPSSASAKTSARPSSAAPRSLVVVRVRRPKFVRKDRQRCAETEVAIAPPPELPHHRGLGRAGPPRRHHRAALAGSPAAHIGSSRSMRARASSWRARRCAAGTPSWPRSLVAARPRDVAGRAGGSPYLCTDATGVLVQAKEKCRVGHFWVLVAPEQHVLYAYSAKHDKKAVDRMLAGYSGYLVADAHAVYDHLYRGGDVIEVACWAHCAAVFLQGVGIGAGACSRGAGAHRRAVSHRAADRRGADAQARGRAPARVARRRRALLRLVPRRGDACARRDAAGQGHPLRAQPARRARTIPRGRAVARCTTTGARTR